MSKGLNTDEFSRDLAKAAAKQLIKQLAENGRVTTHDIMKLQDFTSLFSPYTFDHILVELRAAGAKIQKNVFTLRVKE